MKYTQVMLFTVVSLAATMFMVGCDKQAAQPPADAHEEHPQDGHAEGHSHGAGPHDGTLADWGGGEYHVEFTVDHDKKEATVYVLGSDESTAKPITAAKVLLTIAEPNMQLDLLPVPLEGEAEGTSSRFVGTHESLGVVQEYAGMISGEVDGTPYAGAFEEEAHAEE